MRFSRAFSASLAFILLTTLLPVGVAWGAVQVESRSQPNNSWSASQPDGRADVAPTASLDTLQKMEFLQQEVQELRGRVEEQNHQIQQVLEQQKKLYLDLDKRLREGGAQKTNASSPNNNSGISYEETPAVNSPEAGTAPVTSQVTGISTTAAVSKQEKALEEKTYQQAYHLIQNKDYDGALKAFKSLAQNFPQGKYQPNAHYWLGEIYLTKGNLALAAEAFNVVYAKFPQHPKAADSLLKLGYVEYAKGDWKTAKELLSQVKNQFPGSTSAQLAETRIQKMVHEGHV